MVERTLRTNKGMEVKTALSDAEAVRLARLITNNRFLADLIVKWDADLRRMQHGIKPLGLSESQLAWLHKLAVEGLTPPAAADVGDVKALVDLLNRVRDHVRHPKIRLCVPTTPPGVVMIKLAISFFSAPSHPNSIKVTNGGPWGDSVMYGRIDAAGHMVRYRQCTDDVIATLRRFTLNPAGVAAEHGRLNGRCCFCDNPLRDERSTEVGYGPVCAQRFGMPWGVNRFTFATVMADVDDDRAFDPLIQEADRMDSIRAAEAKFNRDVAYGID